MKNIEAYMSVKDCMIGRDQEVKSIGNHIIRKRIIWSMLLTKLGRKSKNSYLSRLLTKLSKYEVSTPSLQTHQDNITLQANYIAELRLLMKQTNWSKSDTECYILSGNWFNKWGKYVNFTECFEGKKKRIEMKSEDMESNSEHPGEITNEQLLASNKEFYHNYNNESAQCNTVIKDTAEMNRDYYIITKEIWNYLYELYNGYTLKRDCIYFGKNGIVIPDIMMSKVNVVVINKGILKYKQPKRVYFYSNYTFKQLKIHVMQIFRFMHEKNEYQIRLWKLKVSFTEFIKSYKNTVMLL